MSLFVSSSPTPTCPGKTLGVSNMVGRAWLELGPLWPPLLTLLLGATAARGRGGRRGSGDKVKLKLQLSAGWLQAVHSHARKKQNWEYSQIPLSEEAVSPTAGHRSLPGLPPPPHTAHSLTAWRGLHTTIPAHACCPVGMSPLSPALGHRANSASTGHEGKGGMFPISLSKGRFPSSLPSLTPSLGFPSTAGTTTSV